MPKGNLNLNIQEEKLVMKKVKYLKNDKPSKEDGNYFLNYLSMSNLLFRLQVHFNEVWKENVIWNVTHKWFYLFPPKHSKTCTNCDATPGLLLINLSMSPFGWDSPSYHSVLGTLKTTLRHEKCIASIENVNT